jgi:hypothetical protein
MEHPEYFAETFTEKLLTYALGRGLEPYDMSVVRQIVREAAGDNFRFSSIVRGIVTSVPFSMKQKIPTDSTTGSTVASSELAR